LRIADCGSRIERPPADDTLTARLNGHAPATACSGIEGPEAPLPSPRTSLKQPQGLVGREKPDETDDRTDDAGAAAVRSVGVGGISEETPQAAGTGNRETLALPSGGGGVDEANAAGDNPVMERQLLIRPVNGVDDNVILIEEFLIAANHFGMNGHGHRRGARHPRENLGRDLNLRPPDIRFPIQDLPREIRDLNAIEVGYAETRNSA
jgi:hypothetical protein